MIHDIEVELLVVKDCPNERPAAELLRTCLDQVDLWETSFRTRIIHDLHEAEQHAFIGSPTILVNGRDPFGDPAAKPAVACRIYQTDRGPSGLPDPAALQDALRQVRASED